MEMLIGGTWQPAASGRAEEVTSPFDGAIIGTVPVAGADDVRAALDRAESGAATWRRTPAFERMRILLRAADLADERAEQTAQIISAEAGKTITEAGLPDGVLSVLTGPGGSLGDVLVTDPRVRKVSFTGSTATGEHITQVAGIKKLSLELGSSCPVVVLPDADIELAASAVAAGGYINAGQVCISVQRVITHPAIGADFLDALVPKVEAIRTGDPRSVESTMGTLITTTEAERVERDIRGAVTDGAKLLTGGERDGAIVSPAVVAGVDPRSPFSQDELFGPAVAVSLAEDFPSAIAQA